MRFLAALLCIVTQLWAVNANVEKTIFVAPRAVTLPNVLDTLNLHVLSHSHTILSAQLPVTFSSKAVPRGLESWYLLKPLQPGRRYEVRICWPATQPTDFWLDTYSPAQVLDTPELLSSLVSYSDKTKDIPSPTEEQFGATAPVVEHSILLLRVQAAAAYYSANRTLMESPLPVYADIILDPFILNVLPQSLLPFGIFLVIVSTGAWFLSGFIYRYLLSIAAEPESKPHTD